MGSVLKILVGFWNILVLIRYVGFGAAVWKQLTNDGSAVVSSVYHFCLFKLQQSR